MHVPTFARFQHIKNIFVSNVNFIVQFQYSNIGRERLNLTLNYSWILSYLYDHILTFEFRFISIFEYNDIFLVCASIKLSIFAIDFDPTLASTLPVYVAFLVTPKTLSHKFLRFSTAIVSIHANASSFYW